jgi:porphyrinogen peroxidase
VIIAIWAKNDIGDRLQFVGESDSADLPVLQSLSQIVERDRVGLGLGHWLPINMNPEIDSLRGFPAPIGPGSQIPSEPFVLFIWVRGDDRGELIHLSRQACRWL